MSAEFPDQWQFGDFRLDVQRKVLWRGDKSIPMPLKELEVLCLLVRNRGQLVTKDELLSHIWEDSFVEESNLSRHIYLLRKTLKDLGAAEGLIENVPRRGYRFSGDAHAITVGDVVLEKHTRTRTLIEIQDEEMPSLAPRRSGFGLYAFASLALVLTGTAAFFGFLYLGSEAPLPSIRSVAVLPFKTIGGDPQNSYGGAGLADILTTRLSRVAGLRIRPASAVRGVEYQDPVRAGEVLQVDAVLEGTIYYLSERLRVTARLVRVSDRSIIWSGEFEKLRKDELQIQNELARHIVPALAVSLSRDETDALAKVYTESSDAYDLYVRGRTQWNTRRTQGMIEARQLFREAIAADPGFALAYVGLADTLATSQSDADEAETLVLKALELDPNLAEAHASRGFHLMFYEWNWQEAEVAFKRSLELNRNYPTAHHWYATLLAIKGETDAAKSEMHLALELDPQSYNFLADLGQLYYFSGEYAEAENYCLKALEIYPDFLFAHEYLHNIYLKTGQYEKAVVEIAKAEAINASLGSYSSNHDKASAYSNAFRRSGLAGFLDSRFPGTTSEPAEFYFYAMKHALIGENDKAIEYLEKSSDSRMFLSAFLKADPVFENLRSDPRYRAILQKMGLA